ncbi:MAG: putative coiled-coil protein [Streblomastix strix]|uniref:Putative coiled-coil protein n=1 Tax=Streblomastix strix TaxID=222440 RepID=A0A5J4U5N6_9EUKA|nr:MAG: putative coiled-coil protein [Streblomastix strix]
MVFFFTSCDGSFVYYMGRDKFENEELLRFGFPEDIWFHVDGLSSAHVYLRHLPDLRGFPVEIDPTLIPEDVLEECLQLVKGNSIEGCKLSKCSVCWTVFSNLKKDGSMAVGQVGFFDAKAVFHKEKRELFMIDKLSEGRKNEIEQKEKREKHKHDKEMQEYKGFLDPSDMTSNAALKGKTPDQFVDDFWG